MRTFRSLDEVKKYYFPDAYKKEQWEKMSPKEKGRQLAIETIEQVRNDNIIHASLNNGL